jgi:hypothetical protein
MPLFGHANVNVLRLKKVLWNIFAFESPNNITSYFESLSFAILILLLKRDNTGPLGKIYIKRFRIMKIKQNLKNMRF